MRKTVNTGGNISFVYDENLLSPRLIHSDPNLNYLTIKERVKMRERLKNWFDINIKK